MAEKKKGGNTVELVREIAAPIARELGLLLWDVRFVKEGADWFLRIFIDRAEGVSLNDCEAMSRALNEPLDEADPIPMPYCLEVSSPGIGRELTRPEHFEAYMGGKVKVKMIRPLPDGRRDLAATLAACDDGEITLRLESGEELSLAKNSISKVRLADDDFGGMEP